MILDYYVGGLVVLMMLILAVVYGVLYFAVWILCVPAWVVDSSSREIYTGLTLLMKGGHLHVEEGRWIP